MPPRLRRGPGLLAAATRVAANDKPGRERLCRHILRPALANDWLKIIDEGKLRLDFKRPWSDGTTAIELPPLALIGLIKTGEVIERILVAMHLPSEIPALHPARPPPASGRMMTNAEDWVS